MATTDLAKSNKEFFDSTGIVPLVLGAKAKLAGKTWGENPFKGLDAAEEHLFDVLWEDGFFAMGEAASVVKAQAREAWWRDKDAQNPYVEGHWRHNVFQSIIDDLGYMNKPAKATKIERRGDGGPDVGFPYSLIGGEYVGPVAYSLLREFVQEGEKRVLFAYCQDNGLWALWVFKAGGSPVGGPYKSFARELDMLGEMHRIAKGSGRNVRHYHPAGAYDRLLNCTGFRASGDQFMAKGNGNVNYTPFQLIGRA